MSKKKQTDPTLEQLLRVKRPAWVQKFYDSVPPITDDGNERYKVCDACKFYSAETGRCERTREKIQMPRDQSCDKFEKK